LIIIAGTPYGSSSSDTNTFFIMFKRIVCAKVAAGDSVNVGFIDHYQSEFVKQAFDPDVSRMGSRAPFVIYVKDGIVHHTQQKNHNIVELTRMLTDHTFGLYQKEPIPYPVNKYTVIWEYVKMWAVSEQVFFGAFKKYIKDYFPNGPVYHRFLYPNFLNAHKLNYK